MFYFNANNSRSFIYCIVTFFTIILHHTSYIRNRRLSQGEVGVHPLYSSPRSAPDHTPFAAA